MIVYIHGFLGSSEDWSPLCKILPSPYQALSNPETIQKPVTLIGYSLGGRLSLDFAAQRPELINNLIILSANPGIEDPSERSARLKWDQKWCDLIDKKGSTIFIQKWYQQPLFHSLREHSDFPTIFNRRTLNKPEDIKRAFQTWSPAILESQWKSIPNFPFRSLFLFGENDLKYRLVRNKLMRLGAQTDLIPNSGHAIHIENPKACASKIQEFLCL